MEISSIEPNIVNKLEDLKLEETKVCESTGALAEDSDDDIEFILT